METFKRDDSICVSCSRRDGDILSDRIVCVALMRIIGRIPLCTDCHELIYGDMPVRNMQKTTIYTH